MLPAQRHDRLSEELAQIVGLVIRHKSMFHAESIEVSAHGRVKGVELVVAPALPSLQHALAAGQPFRQLVDDPGNIGQHRQVGNQIVVGIGIPPDKAHDAGQTDVQSQQVILQQADGAGGAVVDDVHSRQVPPRMQRSPYVGIHRLDGFHRIGQSFSGQVPFEPLVFGVDDAVDRPDGRAGDDVELQPAQVKGMDDARLKQPFGPPTGHDKSALGRLCFGALHQIAPIENNGVEPTEWPILS